MRFVLIDRILDVQPGRSHLEGSNTFASPAPFLLAVKNLSLAEEYLSDHFPGFPVMPGVLMLEALTQAGAWLIRDMEDFAHSIIVLKQAKTIKYGSFVEPGRQLELRVEMTSNDDKDCSFKGVGTIDGQEMVKGRFTLTRYNLRDKRSGTSPDRRIDCRGAPRSLQHATERFGGSTGHCPTAGFARAAGSGVSRHVKSTGAVWRRRPLCDVHGRFWTAEHDIRSHGDGF